MLIGEASHSTREFYAARAAMTRQLIEERFCTVAAKADWPDAYRVNRYVRGRGDDATASGQDRDLLAVQLVHQYLRVLRTRVVFSGRRPHLGIRRHGTVPPGHLTGVVMTGNYPMWSPPGIDPEMITTWFDYTAEDAWLRGTERPSN